MTDATIDVLGIGNAIVDVLAETAESFLESRGLVKGSMNLIDAGTAEDLYGQMGPAVECSGGSAANTVTGVASFGGSAAYIGKVGDDGLGRVFRNEIRGAGVAFDTPPLADDTPTARCLVLVTPDGQRTMQTFLGASALLTPADVDPDRVRASRVTYLEGYLWDPPPAKQAFLEAARIAHEAGRKVALSLSDSFCVERHRDEFRELVDRHVDLLFANEAEIVSLYESAGFDEAVDAVRGRCEVAVLTRGADGSVVIAGPDRIDVGAEPVERVVDTTGAGDLFASGFLFGWTGGRDLAECARLGGLAAAEIIGHYGARPRVPLLDLVG